MRWPRKQNWSARGQLGRRSARAYKWSDCCRRRKGLGQILDYLLALVLNTSHKTNSQYWATADVKLPITTFDRSTLCCESWITNINWLHKKWLVALVKLDPWCAYSAYSAYSSNSDSFGHLLFKNISHHRCLRFPLYLSLLVVLDQYTAVLVGTWWYWVRTGRY